MSKSSRDIEFEKFVLQLPLKEPRRSDDPKNFDMDNVFEHTRSGVEMIVDVDFCHEKGAASTPNSKNLRTEFKEITRGWSLNKNKLHVMEMEFAVKRAKTTKGVVIAQIHGPGKLPNLEVNLKRGKLVVQDHKNKQGTPNAEIGTLISGYKMGTKVHLRIVAGQGEILFYVDGKLSKVVMKSAHDGQYYKAGAYLQGQDKGNYCKVKIYKLKLEVKGDVDEKEDGPDCGTDSD